MAPGNSICLDVSESHTSDRKQSKIDRNEIGDIQLSKPSSFSGVKAILSSSSGVHELLECPVCTNSMYPPLQDAKYQEAHPGVFTAFPFLFAVMLVTGVMVYAY